MYIVLEDGTYPCLVAGTIKLVRWDGQSGHMYHLNSTYERSIGWGNQTFIPLREIYEGSPYVKAGRVTFTTTFNIIQLA